LATQILKNYAQQQFLQEAAFSLT